jgi:DNA polymerase III epsilon subunit family exonuclease
MSVQEIYSDALPICDSESAVDARVHDTVFVAFDTETTGLSPVACRLVELSGVKFASDGTEISTFQALINPEMHIPEGASAVHGITDDMVWDQPLFHEVIPAFIEWATDPEMDGRRGDTVLLAHNASFDLGFLEVAMCKMHMEMPRNLVLDTLSLARATIDEAANYKLQTLVEHLGLESDEGYHRALADSYHVQNLFLKILDCFADDVTISDIAEVAGIMRFIDRSSPDAESEWAGRPEIVAIKQAIESGGDLRIRYSGMRKSDRIVTPRSVLFTAGKPYLSAFCHLAAAERTFRVDKIVQVESLVSHV